MKVKWIEASAGCGKTSFLLNSYRLSANNSLFLTFSKAAAEELKTRLNNPSVKITTLHAFAYEILKCYKPINKLTGKVLSAQALAVLLKDKAVYQLFEWLNKNSDGEIYKQDIIDCSLNAEEPLYSHELLDPLYSTNLIERNQLNNIKVLFYTKKESLRKTIKIPNLNVEASDYETYIKRTLKRLDLHEKFLEKYIAQVRNQLYDILIAKEADIKYSLGIVYYHDLIKEVNGLIQESGEILFKYLGNVQSVYIDEAQDLSVEQLELVYNILNEWKVVDGDLYVAGDPKQLIYEFQGASVEEFKKFKLKLISMSTAFEEVKLNVTYRLSRGLCNFVNKIGQKLDIDYIEHKTQKDIMGSVKIIKIEEYEELLKFIEKDSMILFKQKHPLIEALALKLIKKGYLLNSPFMMLHPVIKDFQHLIRWVVYENHLSLGVVFNAMGKYGLVLEDMFKQSEMQFINSLDATDLIKLFIQWIEYPAVLEHIKSRMQLSTMFFVDLLRQYAQFYRYTPYEAIFDLDDFFSSNSAVFEKGIFLNTIHASKGKESKQVILLDADKKSKFKNDTHRLMYVALTRAKEELLIPILRDSYLNTWAEILIGNESFENFNITLI